MTTESQSQSNIFPGAGDPALCLYAESIEKAAPHYVEFWKELVGEKESDNMDTRRSQAGSKDPNVNRSFLFLQQFSYKAIWELVGAWRAADRCVKTSLRPDRPSHAVHLLRYQECFEIVFARAGACRDALLKCLYIVTDICKGSINWSSEEPTRKAWQYVKDHLADPTEKQEELWNLHKGLYDSFIKPGRNVLIHGNRFSGNLSPDGTLYLVPLEEYCENESWGTNIKNAVLSDMEDSAEVLAKMLNESNKTFEATFDYILSRLRLFATQGLLSCAFVASESPETRGNPTKMPKPGMPPMISGLAGAIEVTPRKTAPNRSRRRR